MIYFLKLFFFNATPPDATTKKKNSFKDRGTVARTNILKTIKTFTGYIKLKLLELSAVRLQPSMDKNRKDNNYKCRYAKIGETKKRIY